MAEVMLLLWSLLPAHASDHFASQVPENGYSNLAASPYDYAGAALGKPTLRFYDLGKPSRVFCPSLVAAPYNYAPGYDQTNPDPKLNPNDYKVIVTVKTGGYLTVKFDTPIEDDPQNWYGMDFIVFGNSAFNGSGLVPGGYVDPNTDMEQYWIDPYAQGRWEPSVVSVSQDGSTWFTYSSGPYADDFAPTQAYAWDYIHHTWGPEMDFTKPIPPSLTKDSFAERMVDDAPVQYTAADAIDLYKGSGGGTAFDLSSLSLPLNTQGCKWIQYIKITGRGGEIDAISRVGHTVEPVSIGQAKALPDGARVTLTDQIVTAGTTEMGDCCYIESPNRSSGIKLTGRMVSRSKKVTVYGVMATTGGEREIQATGMEITGEATLAPVGMSNKTICGAGLSTTGLLVRTWGRVSSSDDSSRTFTINDGSGNAIKCIAPSDPGFTLPSDGRFITVTGISSCEHTLRIVEY